MSNAIEAACREFILHQDTIPLRIARRSVEMWGDYAPAIRAAITAYEAVKGGGVGVKPLKWYHPLNDTKLQRADTIVGTYRVWTHSEANGLWFWALSDGYERAKGDVKSEADGLAAAETDHLSRIRSALTSPASGERDAAIEVTDAMVEDGAVAIDALWSEGEDRGPAFAETEREYQAHCRSTARAALAAALRMDGK